MKRLSILIAALVIIAIACNKDKFTTIPQLKLKSISPSTLTSGDVLTVEGSYTDEEGDLDSVFYVYKWYNGTTQILALDTQRLAFESLNVPQKTREAEILLKFEYQTNNLGIPILSGVSRDTTATFGLILKDKAGNRSEYKESEKIRIKKP